MKRILILVGLILLCSCSLTTTSGTDFTRGSRDATLEAVGNFMANGHKNKIVVHPKSVSVYPISNIVDSRTTIEIPFNTWCGGPDGYRLVTHPWTTPSDEFSCQISEREESKLCRKAKDLARIVKPHLEKGLLGFSVYSGECDGQHFYYDLVTKGFVVWSL
jgi:hypothetical protein